MNRQSLLFPIKQNVQFDKKGKPIDILVCTHVNKGRDKDWYDERRRKNQEVSHGPVQEV